MPNVLYILRCKDLLLLLLIMTLGFNSIEDVKRSTGVNHLHTKAWGPCVSNVHIKSWTSNQLSEFCILTFKVFNDFNVVQGQIQILQLLQATEILWIFNKLQNTNTGLAFWYDIIFDKTGWKVVV